VIDVRTPVEFAEVHVPSAKNIPLDELTKFVVARKNQPVYFLRRTKRMQCSNAKSSMLLLVTMCNRVQT
jgi:rhodanese-related sulfurtransferase